MVEWDRWKIFHIQLRNSLSGNNLPYFNDLLSKIAFFIFFRAITFRKLLLVNSIVYAPELWACIRFLENLEGKIKIKRNTLSYSSGFVSKLISKTMVRLLEWVQSSLRAINWFIAANFRPVAEFRVRVQVKIGICNADFQGTQVGKLSTDWHHTIFLTLFGHSNTARQLKGFNYYLWTLWHIRPSGTPGSHPSLCSRITSL